MKPAANGRCCQAWSRRTGPPRSTCGSCPSTPRPGYDAAESARQRLDRALMYLHGLGLRADGDIATTGAFHAVRREASDSSYDRVLAHQRSEERRVGKE